MANSTKLIENEHGGVQRIGRYELIAEIASGGMATVYLARLSGVGGFQRNVAIKCLHPHLARDDEFVQMFLDEARLAALIHHPNVVPILEVEEGEAGYYLVMDYVEGDTFASLLSRAAVDGKEVPRDISLRILVDMLAGLHAAHELRDDHGRNLGLVHRDVSPQNILVGTDGITRITDFGVARAASRLSATRAGQLKGKLAYMAPEQASGDEDVDRRADVFSAGVVLWEALALRRLFKASNEAATLNRVLNDQIVSPREFSNGVPEEVAHVCLKALARDLDTRYVSCAEFGDALEKAAGSSGCLATGREVATYVNEAVGTSLESHRQAIRQWLERRASEPTPATSSRAPALSRPSPPSRRPSLGGLGDTSAITQASGVGLAPPRPPPSSVGVLSSRLLETSGMLPNPGSDPSQGAWPVPSLPPLPGSAPSTLVSLPLPAPPTGRRSRHLVWGALAALVLSGVAVGIALLRGDPPATPSVAAVPEPVATALPLVAATSSAPKPENPIDPAQPSAVSATELPQEKSEAAAEPEERPTVRSRAVRKPVAKPTGRPATRAEPDLENPYK